MGKNVLPQDYSSVILSHLIKLFTSPDRGTRLALLEHLPEYADKLDKRTVVDKIWPHLVRVASVCPAAAAYLPSKPDSPTPSPLSARPP